ncbi:HEAT repeat domain-containing protein, partial [Elusimicrobiota bacterium]
INTVSFTEDANIKQMQQLYFYGKEYYIEGKYDEAKTEFEKILVISPGHKEAQRMTGKCEKAISLTSTFMQEALNHYREGSLVPAVEKLKKAYEKDEKNYKVRSLMVKILVELGVEYKIISDHEKADNYLKFAQQLLPDDDQIQSLIKDLINMKGEIKPETIQGLKEKGDIVIRERSDNSNSNVEDMISIFGKYKDQQDVLFKEFSGIQNKLQDVLDSSKEEKEELFRLLEERDVIITNMMNKDKAQEWTWKKNLTWAMLAVAVMLIAAAVFIEKKYSKRQEVYAVQEDLQRKLLDSFEKVSLGSGSGVTEYDKKSRKLDIIVNELANGNDLEKKTAVRLLSSFIEDMDYRVRLKAVAVLGSISESKAVSILLKMIKNEGGQVRLQACGMLGDIKSDASAQILFKLADIKDEELKKAAMKSLIKLSNAETISREMREKIKIKLDNISENGDWIVV